MSGTKTLHLPNSARTGGVVLPKRVESEVEREQEQLVQEFDSVTGKLAYYERELRQIDDHLRVVLAKPNTTVDGLKPGYYHIVRLRPGHPAWIKPVEGPNGEWRDLTSQVFDQVAEDDLWNDRTQRERRQKARRAEEARQRQLQRERQDRAREFDERLWHATHTSIAVPRSIGS